MRKKLLAIPVLILVAGTAFQGAVPAAAGGGGCHGPIRDGRGVRADIVNFCFDPATIRVAPGQTVTWTAPVSHPSPQPTSGPGYYYWVLTALGVVVAAGVGCQLGRRRLSGLS
jgi:hypothetical protein